VLPVLHLNGYKIANPTVLARIPHDELRALMEGYGHRPRFVEVTRVEGRLRATRLVLGKHDLAAQVLEHLDGGLRDIVEERVAKAGRHQRDPAALEGSGNPSRVPV